ncbi:MAG: hypothetical protein HY334_02030, partial [Armatimonadetes bacterium]|nr:hypothetical protein [Armatimonadota bacterium]
MRHLTVILLIVLMAGLSLMPVPTGAQGLGRWETRAPMLSQRTEVAG